ncbi:MAG: 7-carboxy-7-deazaguanine synthase QueE [Cryomorphaceae bacterium]|nr:7-carboxy-7-deazaguanine synthase QueE [Cryomorphaceae bacterium]
MSVVEERERLVEGGLFLPLMEDFYTIQGEGFHTGTPSYFVRIGGCDVGCHWCDVKESWNAALHPPTSIENILEKAATHLDVVGCKTVVITGGEPATYNMTPLTLLLKEKGYQIHLETSGAFSFSGTWDWICLSPKKNKPPKSAWYENANELKVIIYNQHDFIWAEEHAAKVNQECKLFLQPEWSRREKMTPLLVDYVMANPKWNISLQTHKYLQIP